MIVLRPACLRDIRDIEQLAKESGSLVYTLPDQRSNLIDKIERSISSFAEDVICPGEESYFFVLEESQTGQVVGTGAVNALSGYRSPFYAFRNDMLIHSSRALNVHSRVHALSLTHDLSDHSQLCTFYVVESVRKTIYPALVTLGRLLFMSVHHQRFTQDWMAVLPGICDDNGRAPFWEHVGRKFIGLDYEQVEFINGTKDGTFIAELMPHYPLYVPLFDEEAQAVMGQVHPQAALQCSLLSRQGFEPDKYVEIFDGGPILSARSNTLSIWRNHRQSKVEVVNQRMLDEEKRLVGFNSSDGFRAFIANVACSDESLMIDRRSADDVGLQDGQIVWHLVMSCNA
jgi:arginine N-succinyltransferase